MFQIFRKKSFTDFVASIKRGYDEQDFLLHKIENVDHLTGRKHAYIQIPTRIAMEFGDFDDNVDNIHLGYDLGQVVRNGEREYLAHLLRTGSKTIQVNDFKEIDGKLRTINDRIDFVFVHRSKFNELFDAYPSQYEQTEKRHYISPGSRKIYVEIFDKEGFENEVIFFSTEGLTRARKTVGMMVPVNSLEAHTQFSSKDDYISIRAALDFQGKVDIYLNSVVSFEITQKAILFEIQNKA